jgi:hypothetical protein
MSLRFFGYVWGAVTHPRATFQELARQPLLRPGATLVLSWGVLEGLLFLISHLSHNWPPPPDELEVWLEAWGEFSQLPFLKIPVEQYRLFQAILMVPLVLTIWILMAGTARLLSILFGGRASFDQYLSVLAFPIFTSWFLAGMLDTTYNILLGPQLVPALQGAYGPLASAFVLNFPPLNYVIMFSAAAVYNGIAAHTVERMAGAPYAWWKCVIAGLLTFAWPTLLSAVLLR